MKKWFTTILKFAFAACIVSSLFISDGSDSRQVMIAGMLFYLVALTNEIDELKKERS